MTNDIHNLGNTQMTTVIGKRVESDTLTGDVSKQMPTLARDFASFLNRFKEERGSPLSQIYYQHNNPETLMGKLKEADVSPGEVSIRFKLKGWQGTDGHRSIDILLGKKGDTSFPVLSREVGQLDRDGNFVRGYRQPVNMDEIEIKPMKPIGTGELERGLSNAEYQVLRGLVVSNNFTFSSPTDLELENQVMAGVADGLTEKIPKGDPRGNGVILATNPLSN